jgi:O-antigen/teichoic acid export membrane protein
MHHVAAVTATERLVLVAVVGVGVVIGDPAGALVIGLATGAVLATVLAATLIEAQMRRVNRPTIRQIASALRASFGFAMSSLALQAQRLDVAIVGLAAGSFNAGIYAAPARLTNALGILPTAFATSLFPNAAKRRGPLWTRDFVGSLAGLLLVMTVLLTPIFVFAPTLAATLLGHEYESSGDVLRVILVGMLFASVNQPIAIAYQARGFEHFVAKTVALGSVVGLTGIAIGARADGATGAAFGFVALQVLVLGVLLTRPRLLAPEAKAGKSVPSRAHL